MHAIDVTLIHYALFDTNAHLSNLSITCASIQHVLCHHNLMPVVLIHVADTFHARSGSTGVANPTTALIIPLTCANNQQPSGNIRAAD